MIRTIRQFSAGGIVFRKIRGAIQVALIAREGGRIWCLPKGLIEKGERPKETALREVREETGLTGDLAQKLGDITYGYSFSEGKRRFFKKVSFFLIRHTGGNLKKHDFEVDEARWFSIPKALAQLSYPTERRLLEKAKKILHETA